MSSFDFKPKIIVKKLLADIPERGREVLTSRYGLGKTSEKMTLEAIGKKYGITRERVRQIENAALANVRKSKTYKESSEIFNSLKKTISNLGGIISEEDFLNHTAPKDKELQNNVFFLLVVGDAFKRSKEDEDFKHRWHIGDVHAKKVED
ncbi:MAG: sigma factor-like helix-turn-helix DNA-binding protein, partial [bacterium]